MPVTPSSHHVINVIDYTSQRSFEEHVWGGGLSFWLYQQAHPWVRSFIRCLLMKNPFVVWCVGLYTKTKWSKKEIKTFLHRYHEGPDRIDLSEFETHNFPHFNAFFIRKLRRLPMHSSSLIAPATGRYSFFTTPPHYCSIKGTLYAVSQTEELPIRGPMILIRLAPQDYHRFHFPCDGQCSLPKRIKGNLDTVHPWAKSYLFSNTRMVSQIESPFGVIVYIEIGAFNVGSIVQTFSSPTVQKGEEKGYFQCGGSSIVLLFASPLSFSKNIQHLQQSKGEIYMKVGTPLLDI